MNAEPRVIRIVLVNGEDYPLWNSTVTYFQGLIEKGSTINLKSHLDEKRTFTLKVKEMDPEKKLVWGDAMGKRTFLLKPEGKGTLFKMTETIGGPFFPFFARMIPEFDESFEKFVGDLEREVSKHK